MQNLGTVLGVWAHPDDEGYLSAGIMANAARNGQRVVCVTATRGEGADPSRWPPEELGPMREAELTKSLAILGVTDHRWLDYADGGCAAVDAEEAVARIAAIMDEIDPDTILTFGPDGNTGHPDHISVCLWTALAAARTGRSNMLHFATNSNEWADRFEQAALEQGVMMGADSMPRTRVEECSIYETLDEELTELKERAMLAQATQTEELRNAIGANVYREILKEEAFRRP
jgi:LmbE family N-acetylglucosaminyl deacetylase